MWTSTHPRVTILVEATATTATEIEKGIVINSIPSNTEKCLHQVCDTPLAQATDQAVMGDTQLAQAADQAVMGDTQLAQVADQAVMCDTQLAQAADQAVIAAVLEVPIATSPHIYKGRGIGNKEVWIFMNFCDDLKHCIPKKMPVFTCSSSDVSPKAKLN